MSPISSHPDLDQIEDNEAKRSLLNSAIFWGTSGAIFGIHDEPDKYGSVNYLHPIDGTHAKYWFGFTRIDSFKIKSYLKTRFPFMFEEFCDNYLRHSQLIFNPKMLATLGITYYYGTQNPGDLVITFPGSLHMGFNMSINLAEVSFGTKHQLTFGHH